MKKEFEGKKLLILGGNPETTALVKVANEMGVKTIVASARKTDDAKKHCWKASDIDGMDVPGLIALAQEEKVDGVLVGVADILVPSYCKVCDALNLPCYATQRIVDVFSYKDVFKATCESYGIHGIPEYYLSAEMKPEDVAKIKYPVVVKPVDNGGGVGITVVYNESELKYAVQIALDASHSKRFIVERYMGGVEDMGMYYTFKDGGYVKIVHGKPTLYGEAYEITRGAMRRVSEENKTYSFMNLIFISPHFPATYWHFCAGLKQNGVNVLAIADTDYWNLSQELRGSISDYYKVNNLENYDEMYRAVAWLAHKWGKIDWIESNNEYWLEQDARLRTDFNVTTGIQNDHISAIKNKSEMKKYYALGGIPTARQIKGAEGLAKVKAFTKKTGYPIIAKPDNGMGASGTFKIQSDAELEAWFAAHPNAGGFVIEEFITGLLVSYDAIFNADGEPVFENNTIFPTPIMEIVHGNLDTCYWTNKTVPAKLAAVGRRTVKAFGIKSRFVHLEFFQLDRDRTGLGKKGDYVGLEVNMRPPGGYTPDMMNFAHSTDVFQIWADMVAFNEARKPQGEQYFCAYAGRRDGKAYLHSHEEIMDRYGSVMCMAERVPDALADDLCNMAYMVRLKEKKDIDVFFDFVTRRA